MHAPLAPTAEILFSRLREKARASRKRLVFPEGNDARIIAAAEQLEREGLADTVLLTEPVLDESLAEIYFQRQRAKGVSREEAQRNAAQPLFRAALMVASGQADGRLAGW
jgi:phosphate acetyltransferase